MAPKERPILFSAPMVRAILAGRKAMTRRIVKPRHDWYVHEDRVYYEDYVTAQPEPMEVPCPYGEPGDRLWVRETFRPIMSGVNEGGWDYRADDPSASGVGFIPWKPSIFMPRQASRITLQVEAVRVERLQDITDADAIAEGMHKFHGLEMYGYDPHGTPGNCVGDSAGEAFRLLWDKINGPDSWDANPWVWVVSFSRVGDKRKTVDADASIGDTVRQ